MEGAKSRYKLKFKKALLSRHCSHAKFAHGLSDLDEAIEPEAETHNHDEELDDPEGEDQLSVLLVGPHVVDAVFVLPVSAHNVVVTLVEGAKFSSGAEAVHRGDDDHAE